MRCYICNDNYKTFEGREGKFICLSCYKESDTTKIGRHYDVDTILEELERRIPGLLEGPACPGDCSCHCTYESGCALLKKELDTLGKS